MTPQTRLRPRWPDIAAALAVAAFAVALPLTLLTLAAAERIAP
ncbi:MULTISPECIES: hypothetical protein [unclassified Microbacterium]|nr:MULTISPECIES: hypothetical protein [unclassified Microbacterium]